MPAVAYDKMKHSELKDAYNSTLSVVNSFVDRVNNDKDSELSKEELDQWKTKTDELQEISNAMSNTQTGLLERSSSLVMNSQIHHLSNSIKNLGSSITVTPAFEKDPRYGFQTDNEFLQQVLNACKPSTSVEKVDPRLRAVITNAVGSDEYSKGDWKATGVLIPEAMIDRILSLTPEADFITPRCTRIPMAVSTVKIPARVDKNHATSVTGGTRVYRTNETGTVDKTKDQYEMIALEATEIVGEAAATKILMRESPISIPALIEASMKLANVDKRIDELLLGGGNGTPLGVLNAANLALLSVNRQAGQADTEIISGMDVIHMAKRCYGYNQAIWLANFDAFEIIQTLVIESPNNAGLIKLFSPVEGGVTGVLWGRPIYFTEYMPGIATGDGSTISEWDDSMLACVNFSEVLYGERYQEFNRSVHVRFSEREEVFQFVTANDARPWWKTTLSPKRGITTRSPFVALSNEDTSSS